MNQRPGTSDHDIAINLEENNEYGLPDNMADWVVVDAGAHIGAFSLLCLERKARFVYALEPDPENFTLLTHNLANYSSRVCLLQVALSASSGQLELCEYGLVNGLINTGGRSGHLGHSELVVPAMGLLLLTELIEQAHGPIDLLKLDIEGSEWPILEYSPVIEAKRIVGEYHSYFEGKPKAEDILYNLTRLNFNYAEARLHGLSERFGHHYELGLFYGEKLPQLQKGN